MIRMLHFADIHIGMENYGRTEPNTGLSTRVVDFLKRMDEMIAYARNNDVDIAIFAGDAFKNRQPNPTFQREFAWRVRDLSETCPVVLLVGNHDLPNTLMRASSIEIYETLAVPNVLVGAEYGLYQIETKNGVVQVATAPYPSRAGLIDAEQSHGMNINQIDEQLNHKLHTILRDLAMQAAKSAAPRVLAGHFSVTGAEPGSERGVMVGRDVSLMLSEVADPTWDYVALGHIHKHQNLTHGRNDAPPVVYSGSMERIDFGEESDAKGFCWVELERGNTNWRFVTVDARPFVTLRIDVREVSDPTQHVIDVIGNATIEGAIVRVIIQATQEQEAQLREATLQNALREAKVSTVAGIQKDVERQVRSRLGISPEGLSSIELLTRYLQSKGIRDDRIALLLERAEPFLAADGG